MISIYVPVSPPIFAIMPLFAMYLCIYLMLFYLPETNDQTAVVAGVIGGTLAFVILILIIVFLVHRRYTFVCTISKVSYVCTFKKFHMTFYIETLGQSIREYV